MSHLTSSKILIADLDILRKAVAEIQELIWNDKNEFRWYASNRKACDAMISYRDPDGNGMGHEVGIVPCEGGWKIEFDPFDQRLAYIIGRTAEKLTTAYAEAYARDFAERNGFIMERTVDDDGKIVMTMSEP